MRNAKLALACMMVLLLSACGADVPADAAVAEATPDGVAAGAAESTAETATDASSGPAAPDATPPEGGMASPGTSAEVESPGPVVTDRKGNPVPVLPFDVDAIAQSSAALGELPFVSLPDGYAVTNRPTRLDFARFPFRIGEGLHWVEGEAWAGRIGIERALRREKQFSALELRRNLDAALAQAGAVQVFDGPLRRDAYYGSLKDEIGQGFIAGVNLDLDIPTTVHVIRQPARTVWVQLSIGQRQAAMVVVEQKDLQQTAALLPASKLRQHLDTDGRVAIEVNFAVDEADILPDSQPQIDQVLALLREDPSLRLSIDGHTDATGDAARNLKLSEARAGSVVAALESQGIEASRLQAKGHGQSRPVADNATGEGRARNRRVELVRL